MPTAFENAKANKPSWLAWGLPLLAGTLQAISNAWPALFQSPSLGLSTGAPVWWLQLLSLSALAWHLLNTQARGRASAQDKPVLRAALIGWAFATAWLGLTFAWIFVALHTYGGLPAVLAVLAVLSLASVLALYYAFICGLFTALAPYSRAWAAIIFAALWLLAELARGTFLTGFGWGASGYAHVEGPLAHYAPWLGVYGVSALGAGVAMLLAQLFKAACAKKVRPLVTGLLSLALLLLAPGALQTFTAGTTVPAGHLTVTLLQGNIAQDEKFEGTSGVPLALAWYAQQLKASRTDLVVAPETAIPVLPQQLPDAYWDALVQRFATGPQAALIGIPLGDSRSGYTNAVVGLKPGQPQPWRYDKQHLVPFGEFIPPFFRWFTEMMNIPLGDFNRGALRQAPFEWRGQKIAATICYEDLFGEELALQFTDAAQAPTVFVNVSNLAWFGQSQAMDQHLSIARMRALEFARPFVLATNTGLTALVNHQGQVTQQLPRHTRDVLQVDVAGRTGLTPYARWVARWSLWPLWLLALGVLVLTTWRHGCQRSRRT